MQVGKTSTNININDVNIKTVFSLNCKIRKNDKNQIGIDTTNKPITLLKMYPLSYEFLNMKLVIGSPIIPRIKNIK